MSLTKQRVRLSPNNQPSGNSYSSQNFPQINFIIGRQQAFLDPRTLRLNGTFSLKNVSNTPPSIVQNDQTLAASNTNGATLSNSIGISSLFDEANVSTLNGRSIECVRNYNRYLASSKPLVNGSMEYSNGLGLRDPMLSTKSVTNQKTANVSTQFSLPLEAGIFQGGAVNLSEKGFHGLSVDLLLAQNAQVVSPYFLYTGTTPSTKTPVSATSTFSYEINNLTLTFDLLRPDQSLFDRLPSSGAMSYNTISSLHSTLLSSDQTINLRFGASNVISVSHSIIPSLHINNIRVDSFQQCEPQINVSSTADGDVAKIKSVQYMRAGVLFPYNFMLDSEAQAGINATPAVQAQIMSPYLNSVSLYSNKRNKFNPLTNLGINSAGAPAGSGSMPLASASDPNSLFGLGTAMDSTRQGVSFKDREYAVRIQSQLDDTDANAFFTFTRVRNIAQYSPTGIVVLE